MTKKEVPQKVLDKVMEALKPEMDKVADFKGTDYTFFFGAIGAEGSDIVIGMEIAAYHEGGKLVKHHIRDYMVGTRDDMDEIMDRYNEVVKFREMLKAEE